MAPLQVRGSRRRQEGRDLRRAVLMDRRQRLVAGESPLQHHHPALIWHASSPAGAVEVEDVLAAVTWRPRHVTGTCPAKERRRSSGGRERLLASCGGKPVGRVPSLRDGMRPPRSRTSRKPTSGRRPLDGAWRGGQGANRRELSETSTRAGHLPDQRPFALRPVTVNACARQVPELPAPVQQLEADVLAGSRRERGYFEGVCNRFVQSLAS